MLRSSTLTSRPACSKWRKGTLTEILNCLLNIPFTSQLIVSHLWLRDTITDVRLMAVQGSRYECIYCAGHQQWDRRSQQGGADPYEGHRFRVRNAVQCSATILYTNNTWYPNSLCFSSLRYVEGPMQQEMQVGSITLHSLFFIRFHQVLQISNSSAFNPTLIPPSWLHLQEPLHFNVCAENEEILARAVARVSELVSKAKMELERFWAMGNLK